MITAVVRFRLPQGTTHDDAKAMFEKSAPNYRGVPGLVRKYYLYGDDLTGGGVYLWNSRAAAERFYSNSWKSTIAQRFGAQPENSVLRNSGDRRKRRRERRHSRRLRGCLALVLGLIAPADISPSSSRPSWISSST